MSKTPEARVQVTVWLMAEDLRRADALIPKLATDRLVTTLGGKITRSTVLRLALTHGLDDLERQHP
jgi:hypothetical protein